MCRRVRFLRVYKQERWMYKSIDAQAHFCAQHSTSPRLPYKHAHAQRSRSLDVHVVHTTLYSSRKDSGRAQERDYPVRNAKNTGNSDHPTHAYAFVSTLCLTRTHGHLELPRLNTKSPRRIGSSTSCESLTNAHHDCVESPFPRSTWTAGVGYRSS